MGFSNEWEKMYKTGAQNSIWPWSDVVALTRHYFKGALGGENRLRVCELGCGAGANIPFFISLKADYYGIEGSKTKVKEINERYSQNVKVVCADFTKEIPFEGCFDLILDRSAITHNSTDDIRKVINLIEQKLSPKGYYFGIDWFTKEFDVYSNSTIISERVDNNTLVFNGGYFEGLGRVHFSDEQHIKELFHNMIIVEMYKKNNTHIIPNNKVEGRINFVAKRK